MVNIGQSSVRLVARAACHACQGTGTDMAFDGPCAMCSEDIPYAATVKQAAPETGGREQTNDRELAQWLRGQSWSSFATDLTAFFDRRGYLTDKQRSAAMSMRAKVEARNAERARIAADRGTGHVIGRATVTEEGFYSHDGIVYEVVRGQTGNLYAKVLVAMGTRKNGKPRFRFEYDRGAIFRLSATDKMSLDDAKAFGRNTGTCCVCGRELTNAASIAAGIGPICANRF